MMSRDNYFKFEQFFIEKQTEKMMKLNKGVCL